MKTRLAFIAAGALCYAVAFPPLEWALAAWLVPLLWLAAVQGLEARPRFWIVFAGGFGAAAAVVFWLWPLFSVLSLCLWAILAFYFGLWGVLAGAPVLPGRLFPLWAAVAWCGVEYLRGEVAPLCFSWMALGYTQQNLPGTLLASAVGVYGVSLAMVLWGGGMLKLLSRLRTLSPRPPLLFVAGLLLLGSVPLLAQVGIPAWNGAVSGTVELQQLAETDEIADFPEQPPPAGLPPDLIVWPEYSLFDDPYERHTSWFLERMRREAGRSRQGLVFGAIDLPAGQPRQADYWNTAFCLNSSGDLAGKAVKNQPIQLLSDGLPASDVTVIQILCADPDQGPLHAGVGICYDGSFQRFAVRMAQRGAEVLIFPTFNMASWGSTQHLQHQRMFQMRAAETNLPVLVAAVSGPTFAAFPGGSASAVLPFGRTDRLRVPLARPGARSLFVRGGWMLGPAACLLTLAGAAEALWQRRLRR